MRFDQESYLIAPRGAAAWWKQFDVIASTRLVKYLSGVVLKRVFVFGLFVYPNDTSETSTDRIA